MGYLKGQPVGATTTIDAAKLKYFDLLTKIPIKD
jgi:hypothetical protein